MLDPLAERFARSLSGDLASDWQDARSRFTRIQGEHAVGLPPASVEQHLIAAGPTGSIPLRILRPVAPGDAPLPVILYFHGGGWVSGDAATHDRLARELAGGVPAAVVFVEYDLAPQQQYPVQNEQAYAALAHIAASAEALGLDASRIAVAGDDAGATIATTVALLAKQRRGPDIAFQLLFCPITAELADGGSAVEFQDGPWLTAEEMGRRLDAVFPDPDRRRESTAMPMQATPQQLNDLPPALVITAECDIVRDQGEAYARRLAVAGVSATSTRFNGTIHDFVVLNALAASPATRGAMAQAIAALRAALYES